MRDQIAHHHQSAGARMVTLVTRDGLSLTGVVRNEDNFSVQLQTLDGNFHFVDRSALTDADIKPSNYQGEQKTNLSNDDLEALVSYLVDAAKAANANGKLKRRPVHHEEDD
jgi:cytochrome c oxidase cbb3-type subunit 3